MHFPADDYLPKNVSLTTCDVLGNIPYDFVGKFDVVHVRTFALVIKQSGPMTVLENLVRMLSESSFRLGS